MRGLSCAIFFAVVFGTAISRPLWSTLADANYLYSSGIGAQPPYLAAYQNPHSPYYIYNVYSDVGGIPNALHVSGKPEFSHIPGYSFYFGTPIYDIRIPLNPIYPVLTPLQPEVPPLTEESSNGDNYDGVEKLDTKVDTDTGTKKPENSEDNDSIIVEAI